MIRFQKAPVLLFSIIFFLSCGGVHEEPERQPPSTVPVLSASFIWADPNQTWMLTTLTDGAGADTVKAFPAGAIPLNTSQVLKSPVFDIAPLQYYRLDFRASASHKALWAVVFFDEKGEMLLADIYSSFDPTDAEKEHTFYFQSKADAVKAEFWLRPVEEGASVQLESVRIVPQTDPAPVIAWADSIYAAIPPVQTVEPPESRKQLLPETMQRLQNGEKLRIVMLGNSIINDTGNSAWELLVEAAYPDAEIKVITSVRGGTGCWYYRENNRVDTFVLRYQPDLLIIGGISHREDTAAIHDVIRQVRAKSKAEILVCSGPVGKDGDPRTNPAFGIPPEAGDFRLQLQAMARDAGVAYFDMQTEWGKYIQASGKPYDFYLRDPVHANARGRQVLARLLAGYFAREQE